MRFKIIYKVGKSERETIIEANDLEHAEERADQKGLNWVDIVACNIDRMKVGA